MKPFLKPLLPITFLVTVLGFALAQDAAKNDKPGPLKILLIAGGCCHDYATQSRLLKAGIEERLNAEVTVEFNPAKGTDTTFPIYQNADWAKGYDVVLHDECSASVEDPAYVKRILDAHKSGTPAVNLHCAMHSYRWGNIQEPVPAGADNAGWYEMLGVQSTGHGPQSPIAISYVDAAHPVTKGLANWTTINEELYNNIQVFPGATPLAKGLQTQMPRPKKGEAPDPNAKGKEVEAVVVWTNLYGPDKTRIFSTTIGHNNETVADDRYLDLVTRAILWTTGKMSDDGTVADGVLK